VDVVGSLADSIGGFAGIMFGGSIDNSYATGSVDCTGGATVCGGFLGNAQAGTVVTNCYATGLVTGSSTGGFLASQNGANTFTNNFWDKQTSGQTGPVFTGITPKTTSQMKNASSAFTGWNFSTIWHFLSGNYPRLTPFALVSGDPHVVGLKGQKYLIEGAVGFIYNLVSTKSTQVNTLWIRGEGSEHFTVNGEIGIRVGKEKVFVSRLGRVSVNGVPVPQNAHPFYFADNSAYVLRDKQYGGPLIVTPHLSFRAILRGYELDLQNVELLVNGDADVHGLVGQTWNDTNWPKERDREITDQSILFPHLLEGKLEDYVVRDGLFGSDFVFNRFVTDNKNSNSKSDEIAPPSSEYWLIDHSLSFVQAMKHLNLKE